MKDLQKRASSKSQGFQLSLSYSDKCTSYQAEKLHSFVKNVVLPTWHHVGFVCFMEITKLLSNLSLILFGCLSMYYCLLAKLNQRFLNILG